VTLLKRILGIGPASDEPDTESPTVLQIAQKLDRLPSDRAHYLAGFAYILARVANADLRIEESEVDAMVRATASLADLPEADAKLVVEIAQAGTRELGGRENYLVTREFRRISSREQRLGLIECLYAISASDGSISTRESTEVLTIGEELGLSRNEINSLKAGWKEHLAEFQGLRKQPS
jgi:uncharacterized tellurite resistance protein B-like protein